MVDQVTPTQLSLFRSFKKNLIVSKINLHDLFSHIDQNKEPIKFSYFIKRTEYNKELNINRSIWFGSIQFGFFWFSAILNFKFLASWTSLME